MTLKEALAQLKARGDEKVRARYAKEGAKIKSFGVQTGEIRKIAAKIKTDQKLGLALWETDNIDAKLLALLVLKPKDLSPDQLDAMARSVGIAWVADWFSSYIMKEHPERETLRVKWMKDKDPWAARAGWSLTTGRVARSPEGLDLDALLNRLEREMGKAHPAEQWTMNNCLMGIGIHHEKLRKRAIAIGEKLGVYRDYPVSKGCVSPFAPIAIPEMVKRA
jgi:3-methyladenine DNA glycosylase AlkD